MSIMTLLVSYSYVLSYFYVFYSSMEKNTSKTSKASKSNSSTSLSLDHGRFKSYSVLSRCNSFSSCSNDSAVYCGGHAVQTRFRNTKRAIINNSPGPRKRSRNSSGSSISSNMSCVSDKDLKSTSTISLTQKKNEMKNSIGNTRVPRMKYSKINAHSGKLKEETFVNEELSCSENSLVILPNRHNLRGKITRKGCACCPSTCTTVVLRRYKKFVKTSEEKTVISSTKVKTYVQKGPTQPTPQSNKEGSILSTKSKSRKRRSEIEKLYESLHEIEWAKNFSPDNILRQINVRQAASCSAFGRSQDNAKSSRHKIYKDQNVINNFDDEVNAINKSPNSRESKMSLRERDTSSCEVSLKASRNRESCIIPNLDSKQKVGDLETGKITTSDIYHRKQNFKSCSSQSSVNITTCSMSHINVKEININSMESVHHSESLENADFSDAQLSYSSDESSSAVSTSIVNIQSKHLLDFDYKGRNSRNLSETDVSEYSATPTFFDIAEEGIRTIDACFREVGAEVVVSTCYEEESSLPLLTSIRENRISTKTLSNDDPPILEPCIDISFNHNVNNTFTKNYENQIENNQQEKVKGCSKIVVQGIKFDNKKRTSLESLQCDSQIKVESRALKKHAFSCNRDAVTINIGRRILKKYLKQSRSRSRLKVLSHYKLPRSNKISKLMNGSDRNLYCMKSYNEVQENNVTSFNNQDSVLLSPTSKSQELSFKTANSNTKVIFNEGAVEKYPTSRTKKIAVMLNPAKNGSCIFEAGKVLKCTSDKKSSSVISQSSASQPKSLIAPFISTTGGNEDRISRPLTSFGLSCHYNAIRVNRSYNYTHIILLVTRGKSIFLTLQALTELRDALIRTNNDSSCQVLIVNGVGDSFCLGIDLKPLIGPRKKIASTEMAVAVKELIEALSEFKKPLAAVVNGPAFGLGMTLLNHADLTIASDKATFCMPYSYLGYMPEGGASLTLPQVVGSTVAMDLLLRGRTLTAREARNIGLITEVLDAKRLPHELVSRVRTLSENPLSALETTKAVVKMQLHVNLRLVLENEVKLLPRMWLTRTCQDSLRRALECGILSE